MTTQTIISLGSISFALIATIALIVYSRRLNKAVASATTARPPGIGDALDPVTLHPGLYAHIKIVVFTACAIMGLIALGTWDIMLLDYGSVAFNLGFPFALVPVIYLGAALIRGTVNKGERGALYCWGIALANVGPGPNLAFPFLVVLDRQPIDLQEIREPGPRDKIFWGDDKEALPAGMVRPIYVNSRSAKAPVAGQATEDAPLDTQMQYGIAYYILWSISDDVATFVQNSRSVDEASSQLKVISASQLDRIIGMRTAEGVIASQSNVNDDFVRAICERARGMGVRVHQAGIIDINLSHDMARVMRDRAAAKFALEKTNMETDGQTRRIREIGKAEGDADYERARGSLEGRADGMAILKKNLGATGEAVLAFEAIREGWPKSTVLAGAGAGSSDLAGAVGTMAATFTAMKGGDQASKKSKEEDGQ